MFVEVLSFRYQQLAIIELCLNALFQKSALSLEYVDHSFFELYETFLVGGI